MKENKEETKLQSEQKTLQEILLSRDIVFEGLPNRQLIVYNELAFEDLRDAIEEYASQFKSQPLPIEGETQGQKSLRLLDEHLSTASKEELQAGVDTVNEMYPDIPHAHHNAPIIAEFTQVPIEGKTQTFTVHPETNGITPPGHIAAETTAFIVTIKAPIEGVEREWIHIDDVIGFAGFMREAECTCTPEWYKQQLSEWLATRKGSI